MTVLDYHRLKNVEVESRDLVLLEAAVRAQRAGFLELVESLLPPPEEKHLTREGWPNYEKLHSLCELYLTATAEQRVFIRSKINWKRAYQLGLFRVQAKEAAVRTKSGELLRLALVSLAIDDLTSGDSRDTILSVGSLLSAAREITLNWSALVHQVAAVSGPATAALLEDFLKNHPS